MKPETLLEQARDFRRAFEQPILNDFTQFGYVRMKLFHMQMGLIAEESQEFLDACEELEMDPHNQEFRVNLLKELSDLVFVAYQFAATYGLDLDQAMQRVYESNMSKLTEDGYAIYRSDGKVLKGPRYKPPVLDDLVPPVTDPLATSK